MEDDKPTEVLTSANPALETLMVVAEWLLQKSGSDTELLVDQDRIEISIRKKG